MFVLVFYLMKVLDGLLVFVEKDACHSDGSPRGCVGGMKRQRLTMELKRVVVLSSLSSEFAFCAWILIFRCAKKRTSILIYLSLRQT